MVLLTSSSISVVLSSGVVCMFTFLLFLSGYVVQQQTVRSLQAALHAPPMPTPTLPVYFQKGHESEWTEVANATEPVGKNAAEAELEFPEERRPSGFQTIMKSDPEPTAPPFSEVGMEVQPLVLGEAVTETSPAAQLSTPSVLSDERTKIVEQIPLTAPSTPEPASESSARLAYAQLLSNPSQICSALLFFRQQMEHGDPDISRIILYPSLWDEDSSSDAYSNAITLMWLVKDQYKIVYESFIVEDSSRERSIEKELIAHLATDNWGLDRIMYLRSPGLALNIPALDSALQASKRNSSLSRGWASASVEPSADHPILLISDEGTHMPRGSNRRLIAKAFTSHANHHENEMDVEAAARTAAYVHFEEGELEHRRTEKEWYGGVFEKYERGRAEVCRDISFDDKRTELRKTKRRGWR
ncbi:hypothetical protein EPUS_08259 [Endocarpon pusillum Z07020]|uniref:Uncharacterized protein n=1 Tax=Endocarpon pusillum (strain Z07020 / HMAS-L-300199) TaxID=1263415 RepID=U1HYP4_ENDPU|nr:uncharacterized protein EPUS_08259 [Endocarpon pusillum Z07020]ERF76005.1 hypothetical protein EPUS_08259 [Endocarpon pusillum Z07020]